MEGVKGSKLEKGPSPVNLRVLNGWLDRYPNKIDAEYLRFGFCNGFRIPVQSARQGYISGYLKSVQDMEHIVRDKTAKEVSGGRRLGPFVARPLPNLRVSPLGMVPKKAAGDFWLIHHLSYPSGRW